MDSVDNIINFLNKYVTDEKISEGTVYNNHFLGYLIQDKILIQSYQFLISKTDIDYQEAFQEYVKLKYIIHKNVSALKKIIEIFDKNDINYVVVKGSALSMQIYNDMYTRQYSDIDVIVSSEDIVRACELLFQMGFHEEFVDHLKCNCFLFSYEDLQQYFLSSKEKKFVKKGYPLIEIKKESGLLGIDFFKQALRSKIILHDNNIAICTLNVIDTFLYLSWTLFENYYIESNLLNDDSVLRDIIDYFFFLKKYGKFLAGKVSLLENFPGSVYVSYSMKILREFFSEKIISDLDTELINFTSKFSLPDWLEIVNSRTSLTVNLFYKEQRVTDYYRYMYDNLYAVQEHFSERYEENRCWEGNFYDLYADDYFENILNVKCSFCLKQDTDYMYLLIKIPLFYKCFDISLNIFNSGKFDISDYVLNSIYSFNNEFTIQNKNNFAEISNEKIGENHAIKISVRKEPRFNFRFFNGDSYFFFFSIELPNMKNKHFIGNLGHFFHPIKLVDLKN